MYALGPLGDGREAPGPLRGAARGGDRYTRLDEREIAADLVPQLMEWPKLSRDQAEFTVEGLLRRWKGRLLGLRPATSESHVRGATKPTELVDPEDSSQQTRRACLQTGSGSR